MLRILMVTDVYFPRINGVSTSIQTFHRELTRLGHEITLVAPAYGQGEPAQDWIHRIPSSYLPVDPEDRVLHRKAIRTLHADRLSGEQYDLIHIQTPFIAYYAGRDLARRMGLPVVMTCHTHFEEYLYHYLPWLPRAAMRSAARWFTRRQCNAADGLVVPSQAMHDVLRGYGVMQPMEIIATGIEETFFNHGDGNRFRDQYGIAVDRPVLVNISRIAHEKNIDFLLHMLAVLKRKVPEVLLVIAGEGPARGHLETLARRLGLEDNVLFVGYLDRATSLLDCYRAGDVFVFASKTETQGLVLLEAMAQETPVVALAAMGTTDILAPQQGAVIAPEETGTFADHVADLLADPARRTSLAKEARTYARTWSARDYALKKGAFYEQVVSQYRNQEASCAT